MATYRYIILVIVWGILVHVFTTKFNTPLEHIIRIPSLEYEHFRRRVRVNTQEIWNYFGSEIGKIRGNSNEIVEKINKLIELAVEYKRSLVSDIDQMRSVDGYEMWRHKEAEDLSNIVQTRLYYLQNPENCANARKTQVSIKRAGFGFQLHCLVNSFIYAYAEERTAIFKSKGWHYHRAGWEEVFQSVSENCTYLYLRKKNIYPNFSFSTNNSSSLHRENNTSMLKEPYLPMAIPDDLAPRLLKLHGNPSAWWISQFLKYLLRPKFVTRKMFRIRMEKLGWKKPIVGVHIRRSDKVNNEASFHSVEEYMTHVEDYYLIQEMKNIKLERRVFLATDDPDVITEARTKYPQYKILGDLDVAKTAKLSIRYEETSLNGIISDIYMLALSDYLVCTFSSNVCRIAYEIMQIYSPDASDHFKSLDDIYFVVGQSDHDSEVILSHNPRNKDEIELKTGDVINVAGNHWDGFAKGQNRKTHKIGLFPQFKVKDKIIRLNFPTYTIIK